MAIVAMGYHGRTRGQVPFGHNALPDLFVDRHHALLSLRPRLAALILLWFLSTLHDDVIVLINLKGREALLDEEGKMKHVLHGLRETLRVHNKVKEVRLLLFLQNLIDLSNSFDSPLRIVCFGRLRGGDLWSQHSIVRPLTLSSFLGWFCDGE